MDFEIKALVIINAGTLAATIIFGYKVIRFINTIEFKTNLMWRDYEFRIRRFRHEDDSGPIGED